MNNGICLANGKSNYTNQLFCLKDKYSTQHFYVNYTKFIWISTHDQMKYDSFQLTYTCNSFHIEKVNGSFWKIEPNHQEITIVKSGSHCFFNVSQPIIMKQTVNVSRYRRLIEKEQAKVEVRLNVWNSSAIVYVITTLLGN